MAAAADQLNSAERKRKRQPDLWARNMKKNLRNKGDENDESRRFQFVDSCCKRRCFDRVNEDVQRKFHADFYRIGDYDKQNHLLAGLMKKVEPKRMAVSPQTKNRRCSWVYSVSHNGEKHVVCKKFLFTVLQFNVKRLDVIQEKLINGQSLNDQRGKHDNRPNKISEEIWDLLKYFCTLVPSKTSHYSRQKTTLQYFMNPTLNLDKLYEMFCEYYNAVCGEELPMKSSTFRKYFNYNLGYSFRQPRSDICNLCFKAENATLTEEEKTAHDLHKRKYKAYKKLKDSLLEHKPDGVVLEFDYARNLPLPRLAVTDQFYNRLLWLFLFNVHNHSDGTSYMFHYMEGMSKKGANSVCSFLYYVLKEVVVRGVKELVVFSDATSGQNRNTTVLRFLLSCAVKLNVKITQVFPVRGHSYNQCDRNFAYYTKKVKKKEPIEVPKAYIDIIRESRAEGFMMIEGEVFDYDTALKQGFKKHPDFYISKAAVITYHSSGTIDVQRGYSCNITETFSILKPTGEVLVRSELSLNKAKRIGVSEAKKRDVNDLMCYLSKASKDFYTKFFQLLTEPLTEETSSDLESCDDSA